MIDPYEAQLRAEKRRALGVVAVILLVVLIGLCVFVNEAAHGYASMFAR